MSAAGKYFAQLCEGVLFEYSSSIQLVRQLQGGDQLVKYLHRTQGLSHDQDYSEVPKISWNDLKNRTSWVLLQYPKGVGAIKQKSGSYEALASTGTEVEEFYSDRGGNVLDFFKSRLGGNPRKIFVGKDEGAVRSKKAQRADRQGEKDRPRVDRDTLLVKFKPLWSKAIAAALADAKGIVGQMIKNDSFDKAANKIKHLQNLTNMQDEFESDPSSVQSKLGPVINKAVLLAAAYHYPDETGEITKSWGSSYSSANTEGPNKLLQDISSGDTTKMGTVLSFFKKVLITG
jgi:hypothetical protein